MVTYYMYDVTYWCMIAIGRNYEGKKSDFQ